MLVTIGKFEIDIAADMDEQRRANKMELERVAAAISSLPTDHQRGAWTTFRELVADRTDRAMMRAITSAKREGTPKLVGELQSQWEQIKSERPHGDPPAIRH
jgi:hypothetical protein